MSDPSPPNKNRWTVMIYLAGDNNLTEESVYALTQMKEVEGLEKAGICVVAQFDPKGSRLPSHRYKISHVSKSSMSEDAQELSDSGKKFDHEVYNQILEFEKKLAALSKRPNKDEERETNTGSPKTLFDFVSWAIKECKADSYMLVLSGHGGGTEQGYLMRDDNPGDSLTIWEMQVALQAISEAHGGLKIDILGMDSCLMTMAEVSYQLKDQAHLMVGSEGYSPVAGWPFKPVLTKMRDVLNEITDEPSERRRKHERREIANAIVNEYVNYYVDYSMGGLSVDQSSVDLDRVEELRTAIDHLAKVLCDELAREDPKFKKELVFAHWEAQSYNGEQFVDLYDFCDLLVEHCSSNKVKTAAKRLLKTRKRFVKHSCYSGPTYQYSKGVSIYFPWAEIDPAYADVLFGRDSKWRGFLEIYVLATRRKPRDAGKYGDNSQPYAMRHTEGKHAPGAGLPEILSMRNPPISGGVSACLTRNKEQKACLKKLARRGRRNSLQN